MILKNGTDIYEICQLQELLTIRSCRDGNDKGNELSTWLEF